MFIVFRTFLFFWLEYFEFLNGNKILKAFFFFNTGSFVASFGLRSAIQQ